MQIKNMVKKLVSGKAKLKRVYFHLMYFQYKAKIPLPSEKNYSHKPVVCCLQDMGKSY